MRYRLYLLFTPELCRSEPFTTLRAALEGGVDLVQWRVKARDRDGARRCLSICGERGVPVIVNDDVDLAVELDAFGAHVGQDDLPAAEARRRLRPGQVLGVSTHDLAQIDRAVTDGADHIGFGPVFPTATKGYAQGQPAGALRAALARSVVPLWPIGGITPTNLPTVLAAGACRVAVSSAILCSSDPEGTARKLRDALDPCGS